MTKFNTDFFESCADDCDGPVALTLRQRLLPVEGKDAVIFPPTYAEIGYNIDTLADGSEVATIDSVGSQANRMEPIFEKEPYASLVPQVKIAYGENKSVSILQAGHRLGDAIIRSAGVGNGVGRDLANEAEEAFNHFLNKGSAEKIAKLAPTSLVFGVWDSRGTQAKQPRIVQSVIRAWEVNKLTRSAQFTPAIDYTKHVEFTKDEQKKLSERGFVHVPSTEEPGGIVVHGDILRTITVNLVALRRLEAEDDCVSLKLRRYILGLTLVAATAPFDGFLRQGCLLTSDPDTPSLWEAVKRDGTRDKGELDERTVLDFAEREAKNFGVGESLTVEFDKNQAEKDAKTKKVKD